MKKSITIFLTLFLILLTALIKNSTKRIDDDIFIVNGYAQTVPFHYYIIDFCTQELIERYEQRVLQST